jgi:hypothetical protein
MPDEWKRTFRHPEIGMLNLEKTWRCIRGTDGITLRIVTSLREKMGW